MALVDQRESAFKFPALSAITMWALLVCPNLADFSSPGLKSNLLRLITVNRYQY